MRRVGTLLMFLALLIVPREAQVSKLHLDRVSLDDLVARAPVIVVAVPVPDSRAERRISLGAGIQSYLFVEERYRVVERLRGPDTLAAGAELTLTSFGAEALEGHIEYYAEGLSRSYKVMAYEPEPPLPADPASPRIMFLERRVLLEAGPRAKGGAAFKKATDGFALVCWGAMENVARKDEVIALVGQRPCAGLLNITIGVHGDPRGADDDVSDEVRKMFPEERTISWRTVNLRPRAVGKITRP